MSKIRNVKTILKSFDDPPSPTSTFFEWFFRKNKQKTLQNQGLRGIVQKSC